MMETPKSLKGHKWEYIEAFGGHTYYRLKDDNKLLRIDWDCNLLRVWFYRTKEVERYSNKSFSLFGFKKIRIKEIVEVKKESDNPCITIALGSMINDKSFMTKLTDSILKTGNHLM